MGKLAKELSFEPKEALLGGEDGMDFYRAIMRTSASRGLPVLFEIGYDQGEDLMALARERGFACEIIKDLSKNDRVAVIKRMPVA